MKTRWTLAATAAAATALFASATVVAQDKMDDKMMTEKKMMMDRMSGLSASERRLMMRAMEVMGRMTPAERQQMMAMMNSGGAMMMDGGRMMMTAARPAPAMVRGILNGWPAKSREVANMVIAKYGPPHEVTPTHLHWHNNGPWKRTTVSRDPVMHDFPMPHPDLMEQVIDYKVPPGKFSDLAMYDGSVIVERTKGEISARCDTEEANFLALNLAHDIITGRHSVEEARKMYAENIKALMAGQKPAYTQKLQFPRQNSNTEDPDKPFMPPAP
jgi:hypothetical protein